MQTSQYTHFLAVMLHNRPVVPVVPTPEARGTPLLEFSVSCFLPRSEGIKADPSLGNTGKKVKIKGSLLFL